MRIIQFNLDKPYESKKPIVSCIGYFDGLHLGHKQLIDKTIEKSREYNAEPSLITFDPDPWVTIKDLKNVKHLSTMKQRINLAASLGIKNIIILQFTKQMSNLTHDEFYEKVLKPLNLKAIVCGFDFHYGLKGLGNSETLKEKMDDVCVVDCVMMDNEKISTTRITKCLEEGNVAKANELLGYRYCIEGHVIYGHQQGRTIGFPTANIGIVEEFILPKPAVYAGYIKVKNQWYKCMVNIGHNPTFNTSEKLSVEAHIADFSDMIYGESVTLEFDHFLRDEKKFSNKSNLALQLDQDISSVKRELGPHE